MDSLLTTTEADKGVKSFLMEQQQKAIGRMAKKHGYMEYLFATRDTYKGNWDMEYKHGWGEYQFAKQGHTYTGMWDKNQRHGKGTYDFGNGTVQNGNFE